MRCRRIAIAGLTVAACGLCGLFYASNPPPSNRTAQPTTVPTVALMATAAASPTFTLTPTLTMTPTLTVTPSPEPIEAQVQRIADRIVVGDVVSVVVNDLAQVVVVNFDMRGLFDYDIDFTGREMAQLACGLRDSGLVAGYTYQFSAMINLVDAYGNTSTDDGVTARLLPDAISRINCANVTAVNLEAIAESWNIHPALLR